MTPIKRYEEPESPPGSLLKGRCVVFEQGGKLWRCTEREWQRMEDEQRRKTA